MRNHYFLIAVLILLAFGGGLFYGVKLFRDSFEKGIGAGIYADLVEIELASRPPRAVDEKPLTLLFAGDVMLAREIGNIMGRQKDFRYPFLRIAETIQRADIAFANLESPISSRGINQGSAYSFRADPRAAEGLAYAGFDVLSLANNHILDYGSDALTDTIDILRANKIHPVGAGKNIEEANAPAIMTVGDTRIAFLAYTDLYPKGLEAKTQSPGISSFEIERARTAIQRLKEKKAADIVIVSFHWGEEYQTNANESQKNIAHVLADAGADLIVGHHPHVVQEVEQYSPPSREASDGRRGSWIAYSLGNFVFDQNFSEGTKRGLVSSVLVRGKHIERVQELPISFSASFQPVFDAE